MVSVFFGIVLWVCIIEFVVGVNWQSIRCSQTAVVNKLLEIVTCVQLFVHMKIVDRNKGFVAKLAFVLLHEMLKLVDAKGACLVKQLRTVGALVVFITDTLVTTKRVWMRKLRTTETTFIALRQTQLLIGWYDIVPRPM